LLARVVHPPIRYSAITWGDASRFGADLAPASYIEFGSSICYYDIYWRTQHFEQHLVVDFVYHSFSFLMHRWRSV
jgi:hypothetical protein